MLLAALCRSLRVVARRKEDFFTLSREGRPNSVPESGGEEGGWVFTEEMLQRVPWAKLVATGPEATLESHHRFHCTICPINVSMRSREINEIKRQYLSGILLRQDQRSQER